MALSFLSLVYGFFFDSKPWMKWALLAATIPIAITANASRVALTGILTEFNPDLAEGFFHLLEGWVIFVVAGVAGTVHHHQLINMVYKRFFKARLQPEGAAAPMKFTFLKSKPAIILTILLLSQAVLLFSFTQKEAVPRKPGHWLICRRFSTIGPKSRTE